VKVGIEFDFHSLEFFIRVKEFSEYPHKSRYCLLVITQFHIMDEVWIEKGIGIMEVTTNQNSFFLRATSNGLTRWLGILKGVFRKAAT
jgi:hypothetical protein